MLLFLTLALSALSACPLPQASAAAPEEAMGDRVKGSRAYDLQFFHPAHLSKTFRRRPVRRKNSHYPKDSAHRLRHDEPGALRFYFGGAQGLSLL